MHPDTDQEMPPPVRFFWELQKIIRNSPSTWQGFEPQTILLQWQTCNQLNYTTTTIGIGIGIAVGSVVVISSLSAVFAHCKSTFYRKLIDIIAISNAITIAVYCCYYNCPLLIANVSNTSSKMIIDIAVIVIVIVAAAVINSG